LERVAPQKIATVNTVFPEELTATVGLQGRFEKLFEIRGGKCKN